LVLTILPAKTSSRAQITSMGVNGSSLEVVRGMIHGYIIGDPERAIELLPRALSAKSMRC